MALESLALVRRKGFVKPAPCHSHSHSPIPSPRPRPRPRAGIMKPCALLKLDFLTSAYNKCMHYSESPALVRRNGFIIPATGPSLDLVLVLDGTQSQ